MSLNPNFVGKMTSFAHVRGESEKQWISTLKPWFQLRLSECSSVPSGVVGWCRVPREDGLTLIMDYHQVSLLRWKLPPTCDWGWVGVSPHHSPLTTYPGAQELWRWA